MKMIRSGIAAREKVSDQVPCSDIGSVDRLHRKAKPTMKAHNLCSGANPSRRPDQTAKAPATISETPTEIAIVDSHSIKTGSLKLFIINPCVDPLFAMFIHVTPIGACSQHRNFQAVLAQ